MRVARHKNHIDDNSNIATEPPVITKDKYEKHQSAASHRLKRYRRIQFIKKAVTTAVAATTIGVATVHGAPPSSLDGVFDATKKHDRWSIKTSIETTGPHTKVITVPIDGLANRKNLDSPPDSKLFDGSRLPDNTGGLQEGQIIQTVGYIHLVAFEEGDGDYHIQMNSKSTNDPSDLTPCVIVEVPHPDAAGSPELSAAYAKVRKFIRDTCFGGDEPSGTVKNPVRVSVTGQLFFDLHHAKGAKDPGGGRGKQVKGQTMHATTIWEIHPIIDMQLAP